MWWWLAAALAGPQGASDVPEQAILRPDDDDDDGAPLDEAALLDAVRQHDPLMYKRLQRLQRLDPVAYQRALRGIERRMSRMSRDPEALDRALQIRELTADLLQLRDQYRAASGDQRVQIRAQMVQRALALMELKQAERRARLRELQARLDKLQAEVEERETNKDRLVDKYVDDLLSTP